MSGGSVNDGAMPPRLVVLSGCSGGGKSTLIAELKARDHVVVEEPGRRIIDEEQSSGGSALPWVDLAAFLRRAIDMALSDMAAASHNRWVFFDRGLVDAASALEELTGDAALRALCIKHRYHQRMFMAPPWPEIYLTDAERQHSFDAAVAEFGRLMQAFPALGYDVLMLPQMTPSQRADFVLASLADAIGTD
ncbi:AAA family ATPase [Haematobacter missouriensis]|nr:AAA family ATPase [Haematobacter missouriensis]